MTGDNVETEAGDPNLEDEEEEEGGSSELVVLDPSHVSTKQMNFGSYYHLMYKLLTVLTYQFYINGILCLLEAHHTYWHGTKY